MALTLRVTYDGSQNITGEGKIEENEKCKISGYKMKLSAIIWDCSIGLEQLSVF